MWRSNRFGGDAPGQVVDGTSNAEHIQTQAPSSQGRESMHPVDTGSLESDRILEAMATLNISLNMQGGSWQSAWKLLEPSGD